MEEVDLRWLDVEEGRRYTQTTAMERYPELNGSYSFQDLPFEMARKPKTDHQRARDVKTYLAADIDAFVARLAAPPEPEPVDPLWLDVEEGRRYTQTTAMKRYPQLTLTAFNRNKELAFKIARRPMTGKGGLPYVKTYLAADIDAFAARLDPLWLDVEAGRRYTRAMAMERYPELAWDLFKGKTLPFEIATQPKPGEAFLYVRTYLAADVDALAAERAKKRTRPAPQEPEPEPELKARRASP